MSGVRIKRSSENALHFISYDLLFEYHFSVMSGGVAQNSFVTSKNDLNVNIRGDKDKLSRFIFHKGYEIFIHSLDYDIKNAWTCDKCPKSLNVGEREEDFDDLEVHISDGIDLGIIQNTDVGKDYNYYTMSLINKHPSVKLSLKS